MTPHRMSEEPDFTSEDHLMRLSAARIALITCSADTVRDLTALLSLPDVWPTSRAQALLLLAVHQHRLGHTSEAQDALRRATAVIATLTVRFFLPLAPSSDLRVIARTGGIELPAVVSAPGRLDDVLTRVPLTKRESALIARLETGTTLAEIAEHEFVALSTIKSQLRGLYRKLGASSRADAVLIARRRGFLPIGDASATR
ncbi:LuxR C-terminal-related transcriptional regulator [uncultured Microbacterium sp.]|uniref:helix-turn-helix transcriptional regulator n=1 Tax=uncultured Microbacterium sp. TaxID=191216 RepID=UPI00260E3BCC|nr:LuxR C-terminal-related transcriptional regulator [uncultured Microbacterium sp.]